MKNLNVDAKTIVVLKVTGTSAMQGVSYVQLTNDQVNVNDTEWYPNESTIEETIQWYKDEDLNVEILVDNR